MGPPFGPLGPPFGGPTPPPTTQPTSSPTKSEEPSLSPSSSPTSANAFFIQSSEGSTNPAKLIFPEVPAGVYNVKVRFFVELEAELQLETDDDVSFRNILETFAAAQTELWLGPHYISVSVIDASHEQCGAIEFN